MQINFSDTNFYCLTIPQNTNRIAHLEEEFKNYNVQPIYSIPAELFNGNKIKSGASGYLKICNNAVNEMPQNGFKPFITLEDDVKKYREFPESITIPNDADLCYIGLSKWGITNKRDGQQTVLYKDIDENTIQVFNMLSTHGIIVCSIRGLCILQKCIMEDFFRGRGYDITLAKVHSRIKAYALKIPLVYQSKHLGGQECGTRLEYTHRSFSEKCLPEEWVNTDLLNVICNSKDGIRELQNKFNEIFMKAEEKSI